MGRTQLRQPPWAIEARAPGRGICEGCFTYWTPRYLSDGVCVLCRYENLTEAEAAVAAHFERATP